MKSSIKIFLLLLSGPLLAQIAFDGDPIRLDSLNSPNGQNYLVLDAFAKRLAYTEERGGVSVSDDIYEIRSIVLEGETWEVVVLPDDLSKKGMSSPIGFKGNELIIGQVDFSKGIYEGKVLSTLNGKTGNAINIPFFKNKAPIQSGCISNDGQFVILSIETNNSYGVEDLYVVKKNVDGSWGSPKNLGYLINTEFQEITPFLAADNKTLFFATNGRVGEGSFDIFFTVRQDDSWRNWSKPINLGKQVNSSGSETSFTFQDGTQWAYFVSSQDSDGYGDIFRIKIKEEIEKDTTQVEKVVIVAATEEKEVTETPSSITLKIIDAATNQAITSQLIMETDTILNVNGLFTIDSLNGQEVEIKSTGYLPKMLMLDEQLQPGENTVRLNSIAKGSTITLEHVLFQRGTANLVEGSEKELNLVVEVMNDNPKIRILLKGHTDNTGDPVKNVKLSEERVRSVKEYLISRGISAFRVTGKGFGGNQPIASNATEETRKMNRRVEFEVLED